MTSARAPAIQHRSAYKRAESSGPLRPTGHQTDSSLTLNGIERGPTVLDRSDRGVSEPAKSPPILAGRGWAAMRHPTRPDGSDNPWPPSGRSR